MQWLTPTPPPIVTPGAPVIDLGTADYDLARNIVGGWTWLQQNNLIDPLLAIAILILIVFGLLSIAMHLRQVTEGD